jgi:hypothetical protein
MQLRRRQALLAITVGGLVAGTLDLAQACILFGPTVPLAVAGGLLGSQAFRGGATIYLLGILLHFLIACTAAAVYYGASRRLQFLAQHALVCGLFFGIAVDLTMSLIVLPLSALHATGPYQYRELLQGLLVHMVLVGLPISFSVRRFGQ